MPEDWGTDETILAASAASGAIQQQIKSGGAPSTDKVKALQRRINDAGYKPALKVDGKYGPLTQAGEKWLSQRMSAIKTDKVATDAEMMASAMTATTPSSVAAKATAAAMTSASQASKIISAAVPAPAAPKPAAPKPLPAATTQSGPAGRKLLGIPLNVKSGVAAAVGTAVGFLAGGPWGAAIGLPAGFFGGGAVFAGEDEDEDEYE